MSSPRPKTFPVFTATIVDPDWLARFGVAGVVREAMRVITRSKTKIRSNSYRFSAKPLGVDFLISTPGDEANAQVTARVLFQGVDFSRLRH